MIANWKDLEKHRNILQLMIEVASNYLDKEVISVQLKGFLYSTERVCAKLYLSQSKVKYLELLLALKNLGDVVEQQFKHHVTLIERANKEG